MCSRRVAVLEARFFTSHNDVCFQKKNLFPFEDELLNN